MSAFARKSLVVFMLVAVASSLVFAAGASAKWRPARTGPDRSFGNAGRASVPIPRGAVVDLQDNMHGVLASRSGGYYIFAALASSRSNASRGGIIVKYNARGGRDRSFGNAGVLRTRKRLEPAALDELSDGSLLLTLASRGRDYGVKFWEVRRLRADGSRYDRFAGDGELRFKELDEENKTLPEIYPLNGSRFALVLGDLDPRSAGTRLRVYGGSGRPEVTFGANGYASFDFVIDSVSAVRRGGLLVAGTTDTHVLIAKLSEHGGPVLSWGTAGVADSGQLTERRWAHVTSNDDEGGDDEDGQEFQLARANVISAGRGASVTFNAILQNMDYVDVYTWGQKLNGGGTFDRSWGKKGRVELYGYGWTSESDGDSYGAAAEPMADGRFFTASYSSENWGDYTEVTIECVGASGKDRAAGSKRYVSRRFDEYDHAISRSGKYYLGFGYFGHDYALLRIRF